MNLENSERPADISERLSQIQLRLFDKKFDFYKQKQQGSTKTKYLDNDEVKQRKIRDSRQDRRSEYELLKDQISKIRYEQELMHRQLDENLRLRKKKTPPAKVISVTSSIKDKKTTGAALPTNRSSNQMFTMMQMMMLQQQQQMQNLMTARLLSDNTTSNSMPPQQYIVVVPQPTSQSSIPPSWHKSPRMENQFLNRNHPRRNRQDSRGSTTLESETVSLASDKETVQSEQNEMPLSGNGKFPFPGNSSQQQLRRLGYAAFFCASLFRLANENKFRPSQDFIFELRLKEIEKALHKIYLQPEGRIYSLFLETTIGNNCADFQVNSQQLNDVLIKLSHLITEIMPKDGILGATRNSCVYEMLIVGQKFPPQYFFSIEKELILVNTEETTLNMQNEGAVMLLYGVFVIRAMVLTLFMRPKLYGLIAQLSSIAQENLKMLSTLLFYIYRQIITELKSKSQKSKTLPRFSPVPNEVAQFLFSDEQLEPVLKSCKKSLENSKKTFLEWGHEYVSRIRESAFS